MIRKWVKILPYWLVMKLVRNTNAGYGKLEAGRKYKVRYFQIDEGEFVVFSEELQEIFDRRREEARKEKINKKLDKINQLLSGDYSLKQELKEQLKEEEKAKNEEMDYEE